MKFDRTVCLNLDKRINERHRIAKEFSAHDIEVSFFLVGNGTLANYQYDHIDEIKPPTCFSYPWAERMSSYNAFLSFKKIVSKAIDDNITSLLICEDDVSLTPDFKSTLERAERQIKENNVTWDILYLGANHTWASTEQVSDNLLRLRHNSLCWHCVALNKSIFSDVLRLPIMGPIDYICGKMLQPIKKCYAVWPSIAVQQPGYSYCDGKVRDYSEFWSSKGSCDVIR